MYIFRIDPVVELVHVHLRCRRQAHERAFSSFGYHRAVWQLAAGYGGSCDLIISQFSSWGGGAGIARCETENFLTLGGYTIIEFSPDMSR